MSRRSGTDEIRRQSDAEPIGPETILDTEGRVVRVVPAVEFRRASKRDPQPITHRWRRRRNSA